MTRQAKYAELCKARMWHIVDVRLGSKVNGKRLTLDAIGATLPNYHTRRLGVPRERVRQLLAKALITLKESVHDPMLFNPMTGRWERDPARKIRTTHASELEAIRTCRPCRERLCAILKEHPYNPRLYPPPPQ